MKSPLQGPLLGYNSTYVYTYTHVFYIYINYICGNRSYMKIEAGRVCSAVGLVQGSTAGLWVLEGKL